MDSDAQQSKLSRIAEQNQRDLFDLGNHKADSEICSWPVEEPIFCVKALQVAERSVAERFLSENLEKHATSLSGRQKISLKSARRGPRNSLNSRQTQGAPFRQTFLNV